MEKNFDATIKILYYNLEVTDLNSENNFLQRKIKLRIINFFLKFYVGKASCI